MPRRHGPGRGTRHTRGVFSGVTLATIPSGVTIDYRGMLTPQGTYLRYNAATVAWSGASLSITHGFSTLYHIGASIIGTGSAASETCAPVFYDDGYAATLALAFRTVTNHAMLASGGTVTWTAMGLV